MLKLFAVVLLILGGLLMVCTVLIHLFRVTVEAIKEQDYVSFCMLIGTWVILIAVALLMYINLN